MADTDPTPKVVVVEVVKNSPAHRAGLHGYVILLYVCMYVCTEQFGTLLYY